MLANASAMKNDMKKGKVYFIGFGPGDPELLTIKAYRILERSDLIIYPGSLIEENFLSEFSGEKVDSYGKRLEDIIELIVEAVERRKTVARIQSGDPSIFGAIGEQIRELKRRKIDFEVIPGVSSVFASAASLKTELTSPELEGIVIVRPRGKTLNKDHLDEIAKLPLTIVVLLGVDKIDYIAERIASVRGWSEPCAVVYQASRRDEIVLSSNLENIVEEVKKHGIERTATVIVGEAIKGYIERSYLYGKGCGYGCGL